MSVLNIQDEIEELKKKLGNINNQPLVLENPEESDEETVSDPETEKVEETKVELPKEVEEKIRTDSEPTQQLVREPSGQYNKYSPRNKENIVDDDVSDDEYKENDKKILKDTFQKIKENLKVFEELTNRTIRDHQGLDLFSEEIEYLEDQYEQELEIFENTLKMLRNKLPADLDFTEAQYNQLEKRINLVEKRFDKFIASF